MKLKKFATALSAIFAIIAFATLLINTEITRRQIKVQYEHGISAIDSGNYQGGIEALDELGDYMDSNQIIYTAQNELKYREAITLFNNRQYSDCLALFVSLDDYKNSQAYYAIARESLELYQQALNNYESKNYLKAHMTFTELGDYANSRELSNQSQNCLTRLANSKTISAGIQISAGVTKDNTIEVAGNFKTDKAEVKNYKDIISVSANNEILMGLKMDGSVITIKRDPAYKYRIDTDDWTDIVAISAGEQYVVGLKSDGTVKAQGINGYGETNIDDWHDIIAIDTGWQHTVGLDKNGSIHIAGFQSQKLLAAIENNRSEWVDIVSISTGGTTGKGNNGKGHVVALKRDGTVVAVGDNTFGQCNVGDWTDIISISAGDYHTVGLKSDGTVVTTQSKSAFPDSYSEISTWKDIVSISAGYGFTLGLKSDGSLVAAGFNKEGQCDVSDWESIAIRSEWNLTFNET